MPPLENGFRYAHRPPRLRIQHQPKARPFAERCPVRTKQPKVSISPKAVHAAGRPCFHHHRVPDSRKGGELQRKPDNHPHPPHPPQLTERQAKRSAVAIGCLLQITADGRYRRTPSRLGFIEPHPKGFPPNQVHTATLLGWLSWIGLCEHRPHLSHATL